MIPAAIPLKIRQSVTAAPGTKMPAWLPAALRNARLADAARATPPPCYHCGEPGTTPIGGDELKRQCAKCGQTFDLVAACEECETAPTS